MRKAEARKIWEQEKQKEKENHLGTECLRTECKGRYVHLTKPYETKDIPDHEAYLECDTCGSHLMHTKFERWFRARQSQAKAHVKTFELSVKSLTKDLERLKERIREEKIALKVAKQERKRWGY